MHRDLLMLATGFLALPFPQQPPVRHSPAPDELSCPNDNIGVADSGGSYITLSDTRNSIKHPQSIVRPTPKLGLISDRDLARRTGMRSQIGLPSDPEGPIDHQGHDLGNRQQRPHRRESAAHWYLADRSNTKDNGLVAAIRAGLSAVDLAAAVTIGVSRRVACFQQAIESYRRAQAIFVQFGHGRARVLCLTRPMRRPPLQVMADN
jgi:hypothetical protein